jgi:predicted metal-binding membrane protein
MSQQLKYKNSAGNEINVPAEFIMVGVLAFIAGVSTTVYFYRSMCCGMEMPGGWTMSMMWMRMPGQTWFGSALSFLLMWLAMMMTMMIPSAIPTFLKTQRRWASLCYMASGYFAVWLIAGIGIYPLGMELAKIEMRSELISRAVPLLSGAALVAAGAIQFSRWKMKHLLGCRSPFGCIISCSGHETSFWLGCKQGVTCCVCCVAPMTILLVLGIMNPLVMIIVTISITVEKLLPGPKVNARLAGITAIVAGFIMTIHWATVNYA